MNRTVVIAAVAMAVCSSARAVEPVVRYDFEDDGFKFQADAQIVVDADGGNGKAPGRVLRLDGDGDCFDVTDDRIASIRGDFSVALWVRVPLPETRFPWTPSGQRLLTFVGGINLHYTGQRPHAWIGAGFGRGVEAKIAPASDAELYRWSPLDSVWRHVALVYDADRSVATLYVDGKVDKTYTLEAGTRVALGDGRLLLGALLLHGKPANTLAGSIDDLRVYHRALSAEQVAAMIEPDLKWITDDPTVAATLPIASGEAARLRAMEAAGVQTVRPVRLPFGAARVGRNDHLGWPIATRVDGTIIVHYHRIVAHHGSPREDADSSHTLVIRSTDGGATWSEPIDLAKFGMTRKPMAFGMAAIGSRDGKAYLATARGLYRSDDRGETWSLIPDALTVEQVGRLPFKHSHNVGPNIVAHPTRGLVIPLGIERDPVMGLLNSTDEGRTWTTTRIDLPDAQVHPLEPTAIVHDGRLVLVSRNHPLPFRFHHVLHDLTRPCFMVTGASGWPPFEHRGVTNIASNRWPDTTALCFNPVTRRFEAVVTNRNGGVLDAETDRTQQMLNLWSIAEADLMRGRGEHWRFEASLMRFEHSMGDNAAKSDVDAVRGVDAAHPGGAVIDRERGVQHIFIYAGRFSGPTGIYRITRVLDTAEWRRHSNPLRRIP